MEQSKAVTAILKKIAVLEAKLPPLEEPFPPEKNTRPNRKALVQLAHYYYLLSLLEQCPDANRKIGQLLYVAGGFSAPRCSGEIWAVSKTGRLLCWSSSPWSWWISTPAAG